MAGRTWSTPALWTTSCVVLVFYILTLFPLGYIFFRHKTRGLTAWIYLAFFVLLQLAGWGIIAGGGRTQGPTYLAPALASVALSPLFIGTAGVLQEWFTTTRVANIDTNAPTAQWLLHAFHLIAIFSFGLILGGNVLEGMEGAPPYTRGLLQAGAFLLSVLFLALCFATVGLWWHHSKDSCQPLIWSVLLALPFLGLRHAYELVTAFDADADINQNYGKLVYRVMLQVIPQAIVLLSLIIGGVMARNINEETRRGRHDTIPLVADEEMRGRVETRRLREYTPPDLHLMSPTAHNVAAVSVVCMKKIANDENVWYNLYSSEAWYNLYSSEAFSREVSKLAYHFCQDALGRPVWLEDIGKYCKY